MEDQREIDLKGWWCERDNKELRDGDLIIYVGIRCKIFDTLTRYEPYILFLERYFSFITIPLYRLLDNPGPRHLEFFYIRHNTKIKFQNNGWITSFECKNPNATLREKLEGTRSKLVISHFNDNKPHQYFGTNGAEPPEYVLNEGADKNADAGAELSKNSRYTYNMKSITNMTAILQTEISASISCPGDNENHTTGVFETDLQYNLIHFNCGTYSMKNTCIEYSTEYLDPNNYISYEQFRNEVHMNGPMGMRENIP